MSLILIIEDDEDLQSTLSDTLHYAGFTVLTASDAQSGILVAQTQLPDLVLCDIGLPDSDGYHVLETLRKEDRTVDIPVIFLTARSSPDAIREGMAMGADDYICKPVQRQDLLAGIRTRLRMRSELFQRMKAKIDTAKASMASRLPHELRTPLSGILGWAEVLETCNPQELVPMINTIGRDIRTSGDRLLRMTNRFMLYIDACFVLPHAADRVRLGQLTPPTPAQVLTQTAHEVATRCGRGCDLVSEGEDACVQMAMELFVALVTELMENAFKFSKQGEMVIVNGSLKHNRYHIRILDHGRGMSPDQVKRIGAFNQFDRDRFEQQGNGLGLAIAMQLAHLHGGVLKIESSPGEQTTVTVSLPAGDCATCQITQSCLKHTEAAPCRKGPLAVQGCAQP
jgi:signal transduction histidine kinase